MTIIGMKELRQNASEIAERVQKGESFTVVKRSKPVFMINPITSGDSPNAELPEWTSQAIKQYRPALEALNKK